MANYSGLTIIIKSNKTNIEMQNIPHLYIIIDNKNFNFIYKVDFVPSWRSFVFRTLG